MLRQVCTSGSLVGAFGLNNIYSDKVHDIHKYNVKIVGSDSKPDPTMTVSRWLI